MSSILVIEDEPRLLRSVLKSLGENGFEAAGAETLAQASDVEISDFQLVVLDLMLPDGDGVEWLKSLRGRGIQTPTLILTARDTVADRVAGLDAGADDYLIKPFALDELLARVRALLRRGHLDQVGVLSVGSLTADLIARTAMRDHQQLNLQNRQFELLVYLMQHANQIVTREMIARDVWRETTATWTNVIEVHINHLRRELEAPGRPVVLHTVRGQGYLLGELP